MCIRVTCRSDCFAGMQHGMATSCRSGSMKFGTTAIGRRRASWRPVSSARKVDTAVTASLSLIDHSVTGLKEGVAPTRVMSVPCSVVTTFRPSSGATWRARMAAAAKGMA
jgi:hypothetical protein